MDSLLRAVPPSYRAAGVALALSAAAHGVAVVGLRMPMPGEDVELEAPAYRATLAAPAPVAEAPAPQVGVAVQPPPRPRRPRPTPPLPEETLAFLPEPAEVPAPFPALDEDLPAGDADGLAGAALASTGALAAPASRPIPGGGEPAAPAPDQVALAQPATPPAPPELPAFSRDALPAEVTISYRLTSAFADGEAEYAWKREGDRYEITGSARATGFFAVFLEGSIDQSATGLVTPQGLRPERFTERRGPTPEEGLAFDWDRRTVEFQRGDERRTGPITGNTVDWLSMIFQLAHLPPPHGEALELRVFTQRKMYEYRLQVVGLELIELPLGVVQALHLRHAGERPEQAVDVWLGVEQHHLPVKLRYPVARNRLMVEQSATSVRMR